MRKLVLALLFANSVQAVKLNAKDEDLDLEAAFRETGESISELTKNFKDATSQGTQSTAQTEDKPAKNNDKTEKTAAKAAKKE